MQVFENISLKKYHTFGIDVKARYFAEYTSVDALKTFLKSGLLSDHKMLHIGGGSNLLFLNGLRVLSMCWIIFGHDQWMRFMNLKNWVDSE